MAIKVALNHRTHYAFDRPVALSPHEIRLRPAAHCRTPIESYSLRVKPAKHFLNWQQDPYGNWIARVVFPEKTRELEITVDLVADMTVINPFDFFVDPSAEKWPFRYTPENARELAAYLEVEPLGPRLTDWLVRARADFADKGMNTIDLLVALNHRVRGDVNYLIRMEPGIQSPEHTLQSAQGSCRDSAWLLVQILRHIGIAARFASGYLIQLTADTKSLDGPSGTDRDFTDLHAWCEAYLPGAGWIGLDATSGLLAGEGHIPLACTALPGSAAPVSGMTDVCQTTLDFKMSVTRIHEDPRVTKPYSDAQWKAIDALGRQVDGELADGDVRLTVGGEPTFISIDDMDGAEWNYAALSPRKLELATDLVQRLRQRFAPGGLLHFGQGKWYPGEPLPRWALSCFWRKDATPLWESDDTPGVTAVSTHEDARRFTQELAQALDLSPEYALPAFEDPWILMRDASNLPPGVNPDDVDAGNPVGYVLPIKAETRAKAASPTTWQSSPWPLRRGKVFLTTGDSPMGYRLPLASLPENLPGEDEPDIALDPFERRDALGKRKPAKNATAAKHERPKRPAAARKVIKTALCVELRKGKLHVFLPPIALLEDFIALVDAIEATAAALGLRIQPRGLRTARRSAPGPLRHHARPWRDRGEHPSVGQLGRAEGTRGGALRGRRASLAWAPISSWSTAAIRARAEATT